MNPTYKTICSTLHPVCTAYKTGITALKEYRAVSDIYQSDKCIQHNKHFKMVRIRNDFYLVRVRRNNHLLSRLFD